MIEVEVLQSLVFDLVVEQSQLNHLSNLVLELQGGFDNSVLHP